MTTDRDTVWSGEAGEPSDASDTIPDLRRPESVRPPEADPVAIGAVPRRVPARVRIMAWVVLLMTALLVLVNVVTWQALSSEVDERIDRALAQEIDEFKEFAAGGVDPVTGTGFADVHSLLNAHLSRQHTDRHEIIFGYVEKGAAPTASPSGSPAAAPAAAVETGWIRQGQEPLSDVSANRRARGEILDASGSRGTIDTDEGRLKWEKIRVEPPAGSANPGGWFVIGFFADADRADAERTVRTLVAVSLVGLVLTGTAAWWVAGRILAPIRLVRQAAAQISEEDLTRRIDVAGKDDVAALAEQFNAMLDRLEGAFSAQRTFVDDASHELRTPITIVRGHLEVMGDAPEERREVVRLVTDELDRMTRIVKDLLLLAKAQRPDFLHPSRVSIAELTSDVDAKVRALGDRDWRLEAIGEGTVRLDPQRVTQAMVQLAHNAVRHTAPGATVRIGSAVPDGRSVAFWVADSGPGIAEDDQRRIFERFARGGSSGSVDRSGAGLGLAIVRAIVESHHGTVEVDSLLGRGSTFTLRFPMTGGGGRR